MLDRTEYGKGTLDLQGRREGDRWVSLAEGSELKSQIKQNSLPMHAATLYLPPCVPWH